VGQQHSFEEQDRNMDLVVSLVMATSAKLRPDLAEENLDLMEDAVALLSSENEFSVERKMKDATQVAACVMRRLAKLEEKDTFLGACLTAIVLKAYDVKVTRSFRLAVAGLIDHFDNTIDLQAKTTAKCSVKTAEICNKNRGLMI
jgi:hypothetical protein